MAESPVIHVGSDTRAKYKKRPCATRSSRSRRLALR